MFNRDNAVGFILLGVCGVVGGYMVYVIMTGNRIDIRVNGTVGAVLSLIFVGLLIYGIASSGFFRRFRGGGGGGRQWPDPQTGRTGGRSLWDRLRGR